MSSPYSLKYVHVSSWFLPILIVTLINISCKRLWTGPSASIFALPAACTSPQSIFHISHLSDYFLDAHKILSYPTYSPSASLHMLIREIKGSSFFFSLILNHYPSSVSYFVFLQYWITDIFWYCFCFISICLWTCPSACKEYPCLTW